MTEVNATYRPGRQDEQGNHIVDERVANIRKTSARAEPVPDYPICDKCDGTGEIVVYDDEGKATKARKFCEACDGTGVKDA